MVFWVIRILQWIKGISFKVNIENIWWFSGEIFDFYQVTIRGSLDKTSEPRMVHHSVERASTQRVVCRLSTRWVTSRLIATTRCLTQGYMLTLSSTLTVVFRWHGVSHDGNPAARSQATKWELHWSNFFFHISQVMLTTSSGALGEKYLA